MKNNINYQLIKYFLIFGIIILIFLWTFQVLFINQYYKFIKTSEIKKVSDKIIKNKNNNNLNSILNNEAFDKSVCIELIDDSYSSIFQSTYVGKNCFTNDAGSIQYKNDFINSNSNDKYYEVNDIKKEASKLVYALKLDTNKYMFISTPLVPVGTTRNILRSQLIIITIIIIILSFVLSYFMAKRFSKPITELSNNAKELSRGNFNNKIDTKSNIDEINELASTLDYTRRELAHTDELRRDLMANVSHDMKTPLTMIKAYAEMINELHRNDVKKRENDSKIIVEEADRLSLLVDDILDLSKMQSNINELNIEEFDLVLLINNILKRYEIFSLEEKYKFIFNTNNKKVLVKADKKKIEQVIYNLINNAINYVGTDKEVVINLTNKDNIKLEIEDHGSGINKEDLPYVWDKYYKNKKKHKRNKIGTGLGLSIVKNILEQHKYEYGVNSTPDICTTFWFIITK